ncbi:hypothetical protein B0H14DRAFT_3788330, partial [Mycena olivaceomarginata]
HSPLLHTLRLKLQISFNENEFPYDGFEDLVDTINIIRLPVLTTLDMSVEMSPDQGAFPGDVDMAPRPNFSPFLTLHPNVTLLGTQWLLKDFSGLPRLQWSGDIFPQFHFVPLANHLCLNKSEVAAVDDTGYAVKLTNELSPASLVQLVSSFPNLTDLDVCISKFLVRTHGKCGRPKRPIEKVFPPRQYIKELSFLLRHLASIEIIILGDHLPPLSEDEDEDIDIFSYAASVEVNYRFSVNRKSTVPKGIKPSVLRVRRNFYAVYLVRYALPVRNDQKRKGKRDGYDRLKHAGDR